MKPISIALTGASGMPYAITLLKELVNFVVARILDHLEVEHNLALPWQG
jgi:3-polyprenyl-4-hydroxybenzoate decarboxylase